MILIGELSLWVAMLMAAWGATVSFAGGRSHRADLIASGERAIHATFALVVLASIGLWAALLTHDFSLEYVASNTSRNLPAVYIFVALWGGQAGSLLFWCLLLAASAATALIGNRASNRDFMPWVTGTLSLAILFFLATMCFGANPYARLDWMPVDGRGMNPQLQSPGMAMHPPMLYFGYVTTSIPFAFAIAALLSRRIDAAWLGAVRRWTLVSWVFLTAGIVIGMWWAYVEPGRGTPWAWDAVENASILPWLTTTALLHSIIVQEKRGALRKWNIVLAASSFLLAVLAAFVTRSGVIGSAPSFARSPIGDWFAGFLLLVLGITIYLLVMRLPTLEARAGLESVVARSRRRYGSHIAHAGTALLFAALAGLAIRQHHDVSLAVGESFAVTDPFGSEWRFVSQGISHFDQLNREVTAIVLDVTRDGKPQKPIVSERRQHVDSRGMHSFEPSTEAGLRGSLALDTYVVLAGVSGDEATERAQLRIGFNPLAMWVWIGGALMAVGGLIGMWPQARRPRVDEGDR